LLMHFVIRIETRVGAGFHKMCRFLVYMMTLPYHSLLYLYTYSEPDSDY
jgi:hypothetical protein